MQSMPTNFVYLKRSASLMVLFLSLGSAAYLAADQPRVADASSQTVSASAAETVDPNKGPSEFNHHLAGWALIGVGLLQLASLSFSRHRALRYVEPALFLLAGAFLALWSDAEIWPRGNLNWYWLFQHDAEARQHKIYALLLSGIGIVEYLRISGRLSRFWKMWAFPVLAVIGACLLLVHDHTGGSGAHSPEAQAYLVNPALDADGKVRPKVLMASEAITPDYASVHDPSEKVPDVHGPESDSMPMNHSHMASDNSPVNAVHHGHHMTPSMLLVEREHLWFMIVGLAIGLFKFLADGEFFQRRAVPYIWPSCMVVLGVMLLFYRE